MVVFQEIETEKADKLTHFFPFTIAVERWSQATDLPVLTSVHKRKTRSSTSQPVPSAQPVTAAQLDISMLGQLSHDQEPSVAKSVQLNIIMKPLKPSSTIFRNRI